MMKSANESEYYPNVPEDKGGVPLPLWRVKFSMDINDADLDENELAKVCWCGGGSTCGCGCGWEWECGCWGRAAAEDTLPGGGPTLTNPNQP